MDKITVGIADGHELMRDAISFVLKRDNRFSVIAESRNGREAIEAAKTLHPDIILLEAMMDPVNGFIAAQLIRIVSPKTKIIGLSVHSDTRYVKRMIESGAQGYIAKTSSKEEIIRGILEVYTGNVFISKEIKGFSRCLRKIAPF